MSEVRLLQTEAEAARARIVDAIEEVAERLSPSTIIREARAEGRKAVLEVRDEGMRALLGARDRAAETVDEVERTIADNPVVFGVAAVALGCAVTLATKRAAPSRTSAEAGDEYARYGIGDSYAADAMRRGPARETAAKRASAAVREAADRVARTIARARDAASEHLSTLGDTLTDRAGQTSDQLAATWDRARDTAGVSAETLSRRARTAAVQVDDAIADNPEAALILGVAAGGLLALLAGDDGLAGDAERY